MSASPDPTEPPYVPEPQRRGTVGLISTCVITLGLCVWTAIHINIVPGGEKKWWRRRFARKVGWSLLAMFAPELVVWRAFEQWAAALRLCRSQNSRLQQGNEAKNAATYKEILQESIILE